MSAPTIDTGTPSTTKAGGRAGRVPVVTAVTGTVFIAGAAFWMSFTALADLARRSGVEASQAWAWPLIVDGIIVTSTVAVVALAGQRATRYPWALLAGGAVVSVTANALHALVAQATTVPAVLAAAVAAVPPLVLLAITHLTVILTRHTRPSGPSTTTGLTAATTTFTVASPVTGGLAPSPAATVVPARVPAPVLAPALSPAVTSTLAAPLGPSVASAPAVVPAVPAMSSGAQGAVAGLAPASVPTPPVGGAAPVVAGSLQASALVPVSVVESGALGPQESVVERLAAAKRAATPATASPVRRTEAGGGAGRAERVGRDAGTQREVADQLRANGWNTARIAAHLGVHRSTVGRWFTNPPTGATPRVERRGTGPPGPRL
jgi:hypothetical protein